MVRDGFYYGAGMFLVAAVAWWLGGWPWTVPPLLLAAFFLWFFRNPERAIPDIPGAVISPADGKITDIVTVEWQGQPRMRVSVFMNVFSVHVNRSPVAGVIESIEYKRGKFLNAMDAVSADLNEQNIVTVRGETHTVVFKQIAGLIARRIVFFKQIGDRVQRGERVGLIKFGSRVDVILPLDATLQVKLGDNVHAGSSILAQLPVAVSGDAAPAAADVSRGL
jgi:phosphatidylserine decarboxylase